MPTKTYVPIATTTLGSATTSYTFTSIPSIYKDLRLVFQGEFSGNDWPFIQVGNGSVDTSTIYSATELTDVAARSYRFTGLSFMLGGGGHAGGANTQCTSLMEFMDYANTTTHKSMLCRYGNMSSDTTAAVSLWRSTAAINTIKVTAANGNNFKIGSTFTLYGLH
jgi:hypothetical protein